MRNELGVHYLHTRIDGNHDDCRVSYESERNDVVTQNSTKPIVSDFLLA